MAGQAVSFDGNSLQTAVILTSSIEHETPADKNMRMFALANANANTVNRVNHNSKTIVIRGKIIGTSITDLDNFLDDFRAYFNNEERYLDIGYGSGTRRYIASAQEPDIGRPNGLKHCSFSVTFICQPFGRDILPTTLISATGRTASTYNDEITIGGSAKFQLPILTISYSSIADGTNKTVTFGNNATGQQLQVTADFASGDVLAFNVVERKILLNGAEQNFSGAFPEFERGAQTAYYGDDFTARTMDYDLIHYRYWK
ncbi:MAG: phage tail family protein [Flavobacteriales bacterium]|nr:phage tail family protein [Flavobacteriales bacterium]MBS4040419.1 phage tail family protein [Flavobacteriales bacterium]